MESVGSMSLPQSLSLLPHDKHRRRNVELPYQNSAKLTEFCLPQWISVTATTTSTQMKRRCCNVVGSNRYSDIFGENGPKTLKENCNVDISRLELLQVVVWHASDSVKTELSQGTVQITCLVS